MLLMPLCNIVVLGMGTISTEFLLRRGGLLLQLLDLNICKPEYYIDVEMLSFGFTQTSQSPRTPKLTLVNGEAAHKPTNLHGQT